MKNIELESLINRKLNSINFIDCIPNGLQVEGKEIVKKIITGVTANKKLINEAIKKNADAIIVHHGFFWKKEPSTIKNIKRQRLKMLLSNDINLYCWHLPLDINPELGNNTQLAKLLNIKIIGEIKPLLLWGELDNYMSGLELSSWIEMCLKRRPLWFGESGSKLIKRIAWCTGSGQKFIDDAAYFGVDAFITGEVSEQVIHSAYEQCIHFYSAGHHATELGGIRALSEWLKENTNLCVTFVDIFNPV